MDRCLYTSKLFVLPSQLAMVIVAGFVCGIPLILKRGYFYIDKGKKILKFK